VTISTLGSHSDIEEVDLNPVHAGSEGATVLDAVILRARSYIQGKAHQ